MGLLEIDRLVFSQKAKLIELTNEYAIRDEQGQQVGTMRQEGQTKLKKIARLVSSLDQFMTHKVAAYEPDGRKVLELTRPAKFVKSKVRVADGEGAPVGTIVQRNVFGKIRFTFEGSNGEQLGGINAQNWRAWNFSIIDPTDREVGRITKKWGGVAKEMFTTADNYALELEPGVTGALRLMALASAVGVDLALKQDARGLG
ncbi:MAG TPA: phospholipid scramblase-related protein [Actinomycetota bacterium]|jgi:uncharacterized protein YxjI